jgi:hypothetical protein
VALAFLGLPGGTDPGVSVDCHCRIRSLCPLADAVIDPCGLDSFLSISLSRLADCAPKWMRCRERHPTWCLVAWAIGSFLVSQIVVGEVVAPLLVHFWPVVWRGIDVC